MEYENSTEQAASLLKLIICDIGFPASLFTSHQFSQFRECCATLINNIIENIRIPNAPNDNLILPIHDLLVCLFCEHTQRHTQIATRLLAHVVM